MFIKLNNLNLCTFLFLEFLLSDDYSLKLPKEASFSQIWDSKVREWSTQNKMPNCSINMLRGQCVITGNDQIALDKHSLSTIPILLIQRPGQCHSISRPGNFIKLTFEL